jgi:hypothetical protein
MPETLYWILICIRFSYATWLHTVFIQTGDFQMPTTLSKIKYGTRSIVHFEALEQTLRLRLVSGHVDKKFVFISRNSLSRTGPLLGVH